MEDESRYFNIAKSRILFEKSMSKDALVFIKQHNLPVDYYRAAAHGFCGYLLNNLVRINGVDIVIDYFLGTSKEDVYDLVGYNREYSQDKNFTVIGLLNGGDTIGFKTNDESVYINFFTGSNVDEDGCTKLAESFKELHDLVASIVYKTLFDYIREFEDQEKIVVWGQDNKVYFSGTVGDAKKNYELCIHKAKALDPLIPKQYCLL